MSADRRPRADCGEFRISIFGFSSVLHLWQGGNSRSSVVALASSIINAEWWAKILEYNITIKIKVPAWLDNLIVLPLLCYRRIRYGYTFRRIPLTRGKFAIVDTDDYPCLKKYKWFATKNASTFYAKRHTHKRERAKTSSVCMHRKIMNAPGDLLVDHINYNGLDNRKANLRLATRRQNNLHVIRTMNPGSSKYKGVSWNTNKKRWHVQITTKGKTIRLGYFKDEIQAAKTYDMAAKVYHGEFAALNFPLFPRRRGC